MPHWLCEWSRFLPNGLHGDISAFEHWGFAVFITAFYLLIASHLSEAYLLQNRNKRTLNSNLRDYWATLINLMIMQINHWSCLHRIRCMGGILKCYFSKMLFVQHIFRNLLMKAICMLPVTMNQKSVSRSHAWCCCANMTRCCDGAVTVTTASIRAWWRSSSLMSSDQSPVRHRKRSGCVASL